MAIGRAPGPIGDAVGSKVVKAQAVLGTAPQFKPVPKGVDACILFPPPGLYQRECYRGEEGLFACWATAAEMIVKHRDSAAKFVRPKFEPIIPSGVQGSDALAMSQIRYMDYVDAKLESWGFRRLPGGMLGDPWDTTRLASELNARGPLLFDGDFFSVPGSGALIHCVAVFGGQDDIVYYRDPGDDNKDVKTMSIRQLGIRARPKARTPWALGASRFDTTPVQR
jgi:Papain-like cysteine protease AvrRpt2